MSTSKHVLTATCYVVADGLDRQTQRRPSCLFKLELEGCQQLLSVVDVGLFSGAFIFMIIQEH